MERMRWWERTGRYKGFAQGLSAYRHITPSTPNDESLRVLDYPSECEHEDDAQGRPAARRRQPTRCGWTGTRRSRTEDGESERRSREGWRSETLLYTVPPVQSALACGANASTQTWMCEAIPGTGCVGDERRSAGKSRTP